MAKPLGVKKLVRPLLAGAGLTGAVAAVNRSLRAAPLPTNVLGGTPRRWTWRGYEIFVTEAGAGPAVLLVHGIWIGASSYEYRRLFALLAQRHRVVAFDLLGTGLSERPDILYTPELFVEQIVDALGTLVDGPATLVGSSLGAAFAIRAAVRAADRATRLVALCPAGLGGILDGRGRPNVLGRLLRSPLAGEAAYNVLASAASLRYVLRRDVYDDPADVTDEVVGRYYAVAHQPGARFVPAAFIGGALDTPVARDLPFVEAPVLVVWSERGCTFAPRANADEFVRLAPRAHLVTIPQTRALPHEERPEATRDAIEAFVA